MPFLIINAVPNEIIDDLNIKFNLHMIKTYLRSEAISPELDEFDKYRRMMESNELVDYDRNTY